MARPGREGDQSGIEGYALAKRGRGNTRPLARLHHVNGGVILSLSKPQPRKPRNMKHLTRETYLSSAIEYLAPKFVNLGHPLPSVRASVGIPAGGKGGKLKRIGECWSNLASADGTTEIFICPSQSNAVDVLAILLHELVHAAVGLKCGHKGAFKRVATSLGLEGPMTATTPGKQLASDLAELSHTLGEYPHAALKTALSGRKKQGTRMLKLECSDCGWTCRTTAQHIQAGTPTCHCGGSIQAV